MGEPDVRWTAKGPALAAGLILLVAALFATGRRAFATAAVLAVLGAGFVGYSLTLKNWCEIQGTTYGQSPWGQGFGGAFDECLKAKGWLAF